MRAPTTFLAAAILTAIVAACGAGPGTSTAATAPPASQATAPTAAPTTTPAEPTATAAAGIGQLYVDPEGAYEIRVDPAWNIEVGTFGEGIEFWLLGPPEDGLTPNLNVLSQRTGGMSLDEYIDASIEGAPALISDFELLSSGKITVGGSEFGVMEYTGTTQGNLLHFLAIFGVNETRAVVATLTTPPASFGTWRAAVEPFMRTLVLT